MPAPASRTPLPPVVLLGAVLAVVAAVTLIAAPVGYRTGLLPLRLALLTVLRWGAYAAGAAAVVSALALVVQLVRPGGPRRGVPVAVASLVAGALMFAIPASFRLGPQVPPIHDITTDTANPPQFVAVVPLNTPDRTVYEGEAIAAQQRAAYPDLQPVILAMPSRDAFDHALATVLDLGWELVEADPEAGRIEATDTTFWFGFKDDVVIRVTPAGENSRIDVRSLSRVGGSDVGKNAERIRAYVAALTS